MAGALIDDNPALAYEHAKAAYRRAARIDIVREALGLTSYANEKYGEALRELRTYRRMSGDLTHISLEADCERGMGRPERALRYLEEVDLQQLSPDAQIELALVLSGAYADMGKSDTGLALIDTLKVESFTEAMRARVEIVRCARLREVGRDEEAEQIEEQWRPVWEAESVEVFDEEIDDEDDELGEEDGEAEREWSDGPDQSGDAEAEAAPESADDAATAGDADDDETVPEETQPMGEEDGEAVPSEDAAEDSEDTDSAPGPEMTGADADEAGSPQDPQDNSADDGEQDAPKDTAGESETDSVTENAPDDADVAGGGSVADADEANDSKLGVQGVEDQDGNPAEPAEPAESDAPETAEPVAVSDGVREDAPPVTQGHEDDMADEPTLFDLSDAGMYEDDHQ
ncbi:MAG: hypothetical protein Q4P33_03440 [Flaviflexus sp.]|nr:hypothetical protein [Flaviflexus sp.]